MNVITNNGKRGVWLDGCAITNGRFNNNIFFGCVFDSSTPGAVNLEIEGSGNVVNALFNSSGTDVDPGTVVKINDSTGDDDIDQSSSNLLYGCFFDGNITQKAKHVHCTNSHNNTASLLFTAICCTGLRKDRIVIDNPIGGDNYRYTVIGHKDTIINRLQLFSANEIGAGVKNITGSDPGGLIYIASDYVHLACFNFLLIYPPSTRIYQSNVLGPFSLI